MHNSHNGSRFTTFDRSITAILIVYHSIVNVTDKQKHIPTQNHTRAHTLPRPRHSCLERLTTDGPTFATHAAKVCPDNWIALCSPFQKCTSTSIRDTSSAQTQTHTHTHKHTRTQTHRNARVTAALITSPLTDPHLQFN